MLDLVLDLVRVLVLVVVLDLDLVLDLDRCFARRSLGGGSVP
ncbi:MAG: hypothetical protein AAFP86_21895 [Planctomycetota bacterium]